jgi:EmrB/QacA subfamily drug resistance transporter
MLSNTISPCDEGVVRGAPDSQGCLQRSRSWVLAATILGSSMAFIDGSVVSVALPAMQADLGAAVREAQWIVNAYMLMLSALILAGGAMGDRFGRRGIFMLGTLVFAVASVACGLAPNAATLIAARAAQGIGGAMLTPGSLAIISAAFPKSERGRAIGTWAGASALTTALGPVLGGWLVDAWSWRAIFFINVPIAAIVLALSARHVPESRAQMGEAGVDWMGAALATAGLGVLTYGLTAAAESGWSDFRVIGPLIAGAVVLAIFIAHEARSRAPMVPLHLFLSRAFSGANLITLLVYFALGGAFFFVPFNLIRIQGYSATEAGAAFLPFTVIMGSLSRWSGGLTERYGAKLPLVVGPIVTAVGFVLLSLTGTGGSFWSRFFPAMTVLGLGMAVSVAPLTTTVMAATEDRFAGAASGINNATARVAGLLAVALMGAVAVGVFRMTIEQRLTAIAASAPLRRALLEEVPKLADASVPREFSAGERRAGEQLLRESFVRSFRVTMLIAAALALCSSLCAALTIPGARRRGSGHLPKSRTHSSELRPH